MKKVISIIIILTLLGSTALSEKITVDLATATMDQLTDAQAKISTCIDELRKAKELGDTISLSGSDTLIQTGLQIPFAPCRVTVNGTVTVTLSHKDQSFVFNPDKEDYACALLADPNLFNVKVDGYGDWSITIVPLSDGSNITCSGVGPYVSDFFSLDADTVVTITTNTFHMNSNYSQITLKYYYQDQLGKWESISLCDAGLSHDAEATDYCESPEFVVLMQPGAVRYFWEIGIKSGVTWKIARQ